jgi:hypothetical protein
MWGRLLGRQGTKALYLYINQYLRSPEHSEAACEQALQMIFWAVRDDPVARGLLADSLAASAALSSHCWSSRSKTL